MLWMRIRIVHGQPLGRGGVVECLVGRDQRHRAETFRLVAVIDFERHGELHGVVGAGACVLPSHMASFNRSGVTSMMEYRAARCWRKRRRIDDARGGVRVLPLRRRATAQVTSTAVMCAM